MRPAILARPLGLYLGVDPGADGALAVVERYDVGQGAIGLRLRQIRWARAFKAEDGSPAMAAAAMARRAVNKDAVFVRAAAVEWPGTRARQSGGDRLAVSAGAAMGALLALCPDAELLTPRPESWLADLSCLARGGDADVKAMHVARLLDGVPGAEPHLIPPRGRVQHDGAADAALIALWAAGLRGPGPSSPRWQLHVVGGEAVVLAPDGGIEMFARPAPVARPPKAALAMIEARGRWAGARGWATATPAASSWLASLGPAGADALRAWGG